MATVLDIITRALQVTGSLATLETPSADDAQLGLQTLNEMIDGWNSQRLNLFTVGYQQYPLQPAQQTYQVGPGGVDFNYPSIVLIQTASVIVPGTSARMELDLLSSVEWAALREKYLIGVFPQRLYCDYNWPISLLNLHPVPSGSITLELYLWSILPAFSTISDPVNFRPGYVEALEYNLALKLAPIYGMQVDQITIALAQTYKQQMQSLNAQFLAGALGPASVPTMPSEGVPQPVAQGPQGQ